MKTVIVALSTLSLLQFAVAQPQGHRRLHRRGGVVTEYATVTSPEVIVWVYEDGQTASVETRTPGVPYATPAQARVEPASATEPTTIPASSSPDAAAPPPVQADAASSSTREAAPASTTTETLPATSSPEPEAAAQPTYQEEVLASPPPGPPPAPAPAPVPASAQPPSPAPVSPSGGLGICYSPYNADGTCKTQDQVDSDIRTLSQSGYHTIRIYGVDCNQIQTVTTAASAHKMHIFAGLLTISNVAGDLASMISQVNNHFDPDVITTIFIGNELVDTGKAAPGDVVAALGVARDILRGAGYRGHVVTVDTFNALIKHPELCAASDFCAANAHAFFDGTVDPQGAGEWVRRQVDRIADAAAAAGAGAGARAADYGGGGGGGGGGGDGGGGGGNKKIVITESGWPHAGAHNGVAVPSPDNQARALESIRAAFADDLFLFTAFDDKWKADGAFGVEKFWGIL